MPSATFIEFDGTAHTVTGEDNISLMRLALDNGIPGIDGDCGGSVPARRAAFLSLKNGAAASDRLLTRSRPAWWTLRWKARRARASRVRSSSRTRWTEW